MKITILGCGASTGVPVIGCSCHVCTSKDRKNKRMRSSILIEDDGKRLLIDTSPDLKQQALDNHITDIDAVLITHDHADHLHGIDEVRAFNLIRNQAIDLYTDNRTLGEIQTRFPYIFKPHNEKFGWYKPLLNAHIVTPESNDPIFITDHFTLKTFIQQHGNHYSLGIRSGGVVYSTDVNHFGDNYPEALDNMELWIVDCLRIEPAPTHAHLELTLSWIERFKPKRAILTHMGHDFDYESFKSQLPDHVEPAYDRMVIEI